MERNNDWLSAVKAALKPYGPFDGYDELCIEHVLLEINHEIAGEKVNGLQKEVQEEEQGSCDGENLPEDYRA